MALLNSFVSYLLLLLIFAATAGAALFLGITLRRRANAKAENAEQEKDAAEA